MLRSLNLVPELFLKSQYLNTFGSVYVSETTLHTWEWQTYLPF